MKYFQPMHELSIAEGILSTIETQLGEIKPIIQINLIIGPLAGISSESLEFWLTEVARLKGFGSPVIVINKTVAMAVCSACGSNYEIKSFYSGCPKCESFERTIISGHECTIETIELEDSPHV
jgi:Zn finger protein HypA/HybF involved in hydrogenase expression